MASGRSRTSGSSADGVGRVLVVEDDALLAMMMGEALNDAGAERVVVCATVAAAVGELDRFRPDVMVLDVHLADRDDGWALAELVTELGPNPPGIVFSTGTPHMIPPEIASLGRVLEKPYEPEALVEAVRELRRRPGLLARLKDAIKGDAEPKTRTGRVG